MVKEGASEEEPEGWCGDDDEALDVQSSRKDAPGLILASGWLRAPSMLPRSPGQLPKGSKAESGSGSRPAQQIRVKGEGLRGGSVQGLMVQPLVQQLQTQPLAVGNHGMRRQVATLQTD